MISKFFLAGILAAAIAFAQRGGGMGGGSGMGGDEGGNARMERGMMAGARSRTDIWSESLQLNREQRKTLKSAMDDGQKEAAPVKEQILKARTALAEAAAAGKGREEIEKAAAAVAAAESKMHQIELNAFVKIYQSLEKEQLPKVRTVYGMMSGIFMGKNWNELN